MDYKIKTFKIFVSYSTVIECSRDQYQPQCMIRYSFSVLFDWSLLLNSNLRSRPLFSDVFKSC